MENDETSTSSLFQSQGKNDSEDETPWMKEEKTDDHSSALDLNSLDNDNKQGAHHPQPSMSSVLPADEEAAAQPPSLQRRGVPRRFSEYIDGRYLESGHYVDEQGKKIPSPGDDDFDDNNAALPFVVNEWAQGTSIHGVPYVTDGLTWTLWKRVVWIVLVLVSSSFMIWQITTLVQQYRSYEVVTDMETMNPSSLDFPEITICAGSSFSESRMNATGIRAPSTEEELVSISETLEETIILMTYGDEDYENMTAVWRPVVLDEWGLCWQFNTSIPLTRMGPFGGLNIWADMRQWDFDPQMPYAILAIWVQQPGTLITDRLPFYGAHPGEATMVNIRLSKIDRVRQSPWSRCKSEAPQYTQSLCQTECIQTHIRESCGCRRWGDLSPEAQDIPYCRQINEKHDQCLRWAFGNESQIIDNNCDCELPPCSEELYEGTIITGRWAEPWMQKMAPYNFFGFDRAYMEENIAMLAVNFETLQYNHFTESKAVTSAQLLGSIGGSMGFFLGISLVSVFELVGDLAVMRLIPRLFGYRNLLGLGVRRSN